MIGAVAGRLVIAAIAAVAILAFIAELIRSPRTPPPGTAGHICDLLEAADIWGKPEPCGCGPGPDGIWQPYSAHKLIAEFSAWANAELSGDKGAS